MSNYIRVAVYEKNISFYNRLINKNIYFKDLIKSNNYYILTLDINDYKKISKLSGTQFVDGFIKETENIFFEPYFFC